MRFRKILPLFFLLAATLQAVVPEGWRFQTQTLPTGQLPTGAPTGTLLVANTDLVEIPETPPEPEGFGAMSMMSMSSVGNVADEITPEIQNLATGLQNNPVRIFEFVYNAIEYEHYYGSKKGAHLTLLEGSGNDKDQAALLVALLRAAGHSASYVTIANIVPYDNTAPYYSTASPLLCSGISWLGLAPNPFPGITFNSSHIPAGWTNTEYAKFFNLYTYFRNAGFPAFLDNNYKSCVITVRTIVKASVNGSTPVLWDPSAKQISGKSAVNFLTATGFNKTNFLNAIGGTVNTSPSYITGISSSAIQTQIRDATTAFNNHIRANRPNDSVREVLGRKENVPQEFGGFGNWLQIDGFLQNDEATELPESVMSTLELTFNTGTPFPIRMPALQGKRLSVTANGNTVEIRLGEDVVHSANITAATYNLKMAVKHPHLKDDGVTPAHDDDDEGPEYKKSASYALIYAFAPSKRLLQSRQRVLDGYIEEVRALNPAWVGEDGTIDLQNLSNATLKRQITTELLNIMGINWLYQTDQTNQISAAINDMNLSMLHRFGRMGQEAGGGFFIDVPLSFSNNLSRDGLNAAASAYALTFAYMFSAFEHGIIDQYNLSANGAVSTVQILHLANASTDSNKNRIYQATSANWSAVSSALLNYTDEQKAEFQTRVNAGATLYLPRNANNGSAGWTWNGSGYVAFNPTTLTTGMIITGGYSGGYSIASTYINPAPLFTNYTSSPNYFNTGSASNIINRSTPTYNVPSQFGADPVDMATGAMVYDKEDLSLGQSGTRGLTFQRHYSSNRNLSDAAKLGYGWTHNYAMKAVVRTAAEAGLGETTPYEAAQIIAASVIINELVKDSTAIKQMVSGALVAKVAVDNLLNNAVSLTMGKETVQFIKQPNGTYTSPAGSKTTLTQSGNYYLATERFGNTYKFDSTNGGRIVEITDLFNKTLTFGYNANGLHTVTDAYGRTLTFGYTGGRISSVSDSTGRSVSFGHTNGNLTTATDPENKTWTFGYDTERRLDELTDPENRTVFVNRYDSEGRVYEQDIEGDPTKTWTLTFTGLRNTETDPLGGEKVFFYDKRGRPTGVRDALGNRTRVFYDGQDHMVERHTAKGEVYKQTFNADHNLTEMEDPIGVKTIYRYDSLKRADQITVRDTDPATPDRITGIEFTAGNITDQPNKVTDAEGNVTRSTYYSDGNLWTATEESSTGNRTTTYYYDVRGMPEKTVYHDTKFEEFVYNVRGSLTSQTDRNGNTTTFLYNTRRQLTDTTQPGNRVTERRYDDSGNLETVTDAEDNVTRYTYGATGKLLTETIAYGTADAETTTHVYDERDWRDYTLDPRNQKTDFGYDAAGRVTSVKNPLNHETIFDYDANGKRTLVRTPLGHETETTYTPLGLEDAVMDPANKVIDYGYNLFGERNALTNRRNNTFEFFYNKNGKPTITETPLGHQLIKTWNDRNLVGTVEEPSGQTTTYVYDDVKRIYTQTDPVGTITFGYDDNGNPETITEGSAVLTREWDELNRPESYTNARNQTLGYQYYDNGLLWKLTYPGNREVTYTYYPTNRLHTVTDWANRTTTYFWDDAGRLERIERPNNVDRTHVYDNANRLERIYERDGQGRLFTYFKFGYDDDGRLTSRYRLPQPRPYALPTASATHDTDNRIETWNSLSLVHDDDGNMTTGPLGAAGLVTYGYDARNRLTSVGSIAAGFTTYVYDAENNRISRTDTTGTTHYLVDPHGDALPRVLVREKPDTSTTSYVYGIGLLYEVNDATGDATYYHYDNIGSTVALTGPTGALTDRMEYDPFGTVTFRTGTSDTPFLYVGQLGVQQEPNGLHYMRARYYSTELRRFLNADPIGFAGGMNWYGYAANNPLSLIDPSGFEPGSSSSIWAGAWTAAVQGGDQFAYTLLTPVRMVGDAFNTARYGITEGLHRAGIMHPAMSGGAFDALTLAGPAALSRPTTVVSRVQSAVASSGDDMVTVYRGVHSRHPDLPSALQGRANPIGGHADAALHNAGNNQSVFTSWTTDRATAFDFAAGKYSGFDDAGGVILQQRVPSSSLIKSPDAFGEFEVLRSGPVSGATPIIITR
jgi:RHS repeat-associated protein